MDKIKEHENLCKKLNEIYKNKNHDYGDSFGETFNKLGIISAVTRISDKYNRLVSLCMLPEEERKVKDESITDTLLDMANYCMMTVIELNKKSEENRNCVHEWEYERTEIVGSELSAQDMYRCTRCGKIDKRNRTEQFIV